MAKASTGSVRTLRCRTVADGRLRQANYIRDLPAQKVAELDLTGEGEAPNGLEALLAAFGSCLAAGIHANALSRHIPIRHLEVQLEAEMFMTAHWGTSDVHPHPIGFETIRASVSIESDVPRGELDALIKHALLWSPVGNTLFNPVNLEVSLADEPVADTAAV